MSPLASPRALRFVALAVVGGLVLAIVCFYAAAWVRLAALFTVPVEGMFGATSADFQLRPGELAERRAHQRSLYATANTLYFVARALPVASAAAAVWCGFQTRHELRHWHWLSFFGLGCLVSIVTAVGLFGSSKLGLTSLFGLDLLALVCAIVDLARRQYGAPGRVIGWATCVLALGVALFLGVASLGMYV